MLDLSTNSNHITWQLWKPSQISAEAHTIWVTWTRHERLQVTVCPRRDNRLALFYLTWLGIWGWFQLTSNAAVTQSWVGTSPPNICFSNVCALLLPPTSARGRLDESCLVVCLKIKLLFNSFSEWMTLCGDFFSYQTELACLGWTHRIPVKTNPQNQMLSEGTFAPGLIVAFGRKEYTNFFQDWNVKGKD